MNSVRKVISISSSTTATVCGYSFFQIVGEDGFIHIAELVPHSAAGGSADLFHDRFDLFFRQDDGQ
tara:strand:- start:149 stop:346 length:198 start_codon:yes stop_codon:yes gene_type:complete